MPITPSQLKALRKVIKRRYHPRRVLTAKPGSRPVYYAPKYPPAPLLPALLTEQELDQVWFLVRKDGRSFEDANRVILSRRKRGRWRG